MLFRMPYAITLFIFLLLPSYAISAETENVPLRPIENSLIITVGVGRILLVIHEDGTIEHGPAFKTDSQAARAFWKAVQYNFPKLCKQNKINGDTK